MPPNQSTPNIHAAIQQSVQIEKQTDRPPERQTESVQSNGNTNPSNVTSSTNTNAHQLSFQFQSLQAENQKLRADLSDLHSKYFDLQMVIPTIEVEEKYKADQQVQKLQSELSFKVGLSFSLYRLSHNLVF
jgi:beta-galactosidase beta subunit